MDSKIIGIIENVVFPDFDNLEIDAKIDTGAYTGALHSTNIHVERKNDKKVLFFSPFDHPEIVHKTNDFKVGNVKSSNGHIQERYFIKTRVNVRGNIYPITLTLTDRSEMRSQLLIGRRFLAAYDFLVDVKQTSGISLAEKDD